MLASHIYMCIFSKYLTNTIALNNMLFVPAAKPISSKNEHLVINNNVLLGLGPPIVHYLKENYHIDWKHVSKNTFRSIFVFLLL